MLKRRKGDIHQNFRRKVLDVEEKKMIEIVENGEETAYKFQTRSSIEGEYRAKTSTSKIIFVTFLSTFLLFMIIVGLFWFFPSNGEKNFKNYKKLIIEVEDLDQTVSQKRQQLSSLIKELKKDNKFDNSLLKEDSNLVLTKEEEQYLNEQISLEQDSELKNVIKTLLNKNKEIKKLKRDVVTLKQNLKPPVIMKANLGHEKIALDFLINEIGLNPRQAAEKVKNVNIFDFTYEGLFVWNYYDNGYFGTFVTKGSADKTPNQIKRIATRAYNNKIYKLKKTEKKLTLKNQNLISELHSSEEKRGMLLEVHDKVLHEKDEMFDTNQNLKEKMLKLEEELRVQNEKIQKLNAFKYSIYSYQQSLDNKIIIESFFGDAEINQKKVLKFPYSLNLSKTNQIIINSEDLNLKKISEVAIYPKSAVKNGRIIIKYSKKNCKLVIGNIDELMGEKITIIVK